MIFRAQSTTKDYERVDLVSLLISRTQSTTKDYERVDLVSLLIFRVQSTTKDHKRVEQTGSGVQTEIEKKTKNKRPLTERQRLQSSMNERVRDAGPAGRFTKRRLKPMLPSFNET